MVVVGGGPRGRGWSASWLGRDRGRSRGQWSVVVVVVGGRGMVVPNMGILS